jgi:hypothetical protein
MIFWYSNKSPSGNAILCAGTGCTLGLLALGLQVGPLLLFLPGIGMGWRALVEETVVGAHEVIAKGLFFLLLFSLFFFSPNNHGSPPVAPVT